MDHYPSERDTIIRCITIQTSDQGYVCCPESQCITRQTRASAAFPDATCQQVINRVINKLGSRVIPTSPVYYLLISCLCKDSRRPFISRITLYWIVI